MTHQTNRIAELEKDNAKLKKDNAMLTATLEEMGEDGFPMKQSGMMMSGNICATGDGFLNTAQLDYIIYTEIGLIHMVLDYLPVVDLMNVSLTNTELRYICLRARTSLPRQYHR